MTDLEQLFPSKEIPLYGKKKVIVKPIPISQISDIIGVITPLLNPENKQLAAKDAAAMVATYGMDLLPLCVDVPTNEIPIAVLPDIIDAILDLNFPMETLKKWLALGTRIAGIKKALLGGNPKVQVK
jgi:hypothetical protein